MANQEVSRSKQAVREQMWAMLEHEGVVPSGVHGHIPAFSGAEEAAERLAELTVWEDAQVVKAVPDKAQLPVRARALQDGKLLYMAVPKLAEDLPFLALDPAALPVEPEEAAERRMAAKVGQPIAVENMQPVDLVVCGSVAVDRRGVRLGKGAGYSDIEMALLQEAGLLGPETTIVTTVHGTQVVGDELPESAHDFRVDLIVTPEEVIRCGPTRRPAGVRWDALSEEQIAAIPVLSAWNSNQR